MIELKPVIEKLNKRESELVNELNKVRDSINALQKVCSHKNEDGSDAFEFEGSDSHRDYYVCTICGEGRRV